MPDRIARLPLFPLHAVLVPGAKLALKVFEARYLDLVSECLRGGQPFGVCLIRRGEETGAPAEPHRVGTFAHIGRWDMEQAGILFIEARGGERFAIERLATEGARLYAEVWILEEEDAEVPKEFEPLLALHARLVDPARAGSAPGARNLGFDLLAALPLPNADKQSLLEETDPRRRLARLAGLLAGSAEPPHH